MFRKVVIMYTQDLLDMYDEMIDECNPEISIFGYTYPASQALEAVDPICYKLGFQEYLDSLVADEVITQKNADEAYFSF